MKHPSADFLDDVIEAVATRVADRVADLLRDAEQPRQAGEPRFVGEKTLAERLGISVRTLQGWRANGTGPPVTKCGRRRIYETAAVEQWLADQAGSNGSAPAAVTPAPANRRRASARAVLREA